MTSWVLAPEAVVTAGAITALLLPAVVSPRTRARLRRWLGWGAAAVAAGALGLELWAGAQTGTLFAGGFTQDRFALFAKAAALLALLVAVLSADWEEETLPGALPFAFLAALGMMASASATGFAQLWAGVALATIAAAAALSRRVRGDVAAAEEVLLREAAARAALGAAALVMVAGLAFAFVAALAGTSTLGDAESALAGDRPVAAAALPALVGLAALFALMVLAPFRYGSSGPATTSPLGAGVAAAFGAGAAGVALVRFAVTVLPLASEWALGTAVAAAVAIMLAGLAASSTGARARTVLGLLGAAQLSWVVAGLAAHDREGFAAAVLLLGATVVALAAAPILLGELEVGGLFDLADLGRRSPGRAAGLALSALSLAGVPPLGGFIGQFLVGLALLRSGFAPALLLALAGTLLTWAAVFRLVHSAYAAGEPEDVRAVRAAARRPPAAAWTVASGAATLGGVLLLAYTVFANPISGLAYQSAEALGLR